MAVADLAHPLEVAVLGNEAAASVLDGLEHHGGDGFGALEGDRLIDRVGRPQRIPLLAPAVGVGVRYVHPARRERFERRAYRGEPCRAERPHRGTVVSELARDELVARLLAADAVVGLSQLPRRLHRL